jgi:hypothetical protein
MSNYFIHKYSLNLNISLPERQQSCLFLVFFHHFKFKLYHYFLTLLRSKNYTVIPDKFNRVVLTDFLNYKNSLISVGTSSSFQHAFTSCPNDSITIGNCPCFADNAYINWWDIIVSRKICISLTIPFVTSCYEPTLENSEKL